LDKLPFELLAGETQVDVKNCLLRMIAMCCQSCSCCHRTKRQVSEFTNNETAIEAVSLVSEFSNYEAAIAVSLLVNSLTCRHLKEETSFTQRGGNSKSIEPTHFGLIGK